MSTKGFDSLVNPSQKDIWRYAKLLGNIGEGSQLSSGQDEFTPLDRVGDLLIKREDKSITGSHKFRSLAYQLTHLLAGGCTRAVLSSSGNAAISASHYAAQAGVKLFTFLSEKTAPAKLAAIKTENIVPILSKKPLRLAKYAAAKYNLPDLRPSRDPNAAIGFRSLGFELFEQNSKLDNIFTFVTSGASLKGISEAFRKLVEMRAVDKVPCLFAVYSEGKLAGGLSGGLKNKEQIEKVCRQSGGGLVEVSDAEISSRENSFGTSAEGVASLIAAEKVKPGGQTVVIFTGRKWPKGEFDSNNFLRAENFADVDKIVSAIGGCPPQADEPLAQACGSGSW
ncbi:MAG: PLP-dependent lyase/thiolase [Patescibacteria group bacterium]